MATILITGINGFLGSNLAKKLAGQHTVIGLARSAKSTGRINGLDVNVYNHADHELEEIFSSQQVDVVIHAATVYRSLNGAVSQMMETNIALPVKLYELCKKYQAKAFINTDTFFNDPANQYSYLADYTLSKKQVIEWLKIALKDTAVINMKLFHMFGPGDSPDKFVSQMITAITTGQTELKLTAGEQIRDFIYVDDVVTAFEAVINKLDTFNENYHEFEVGTGQSVSVREFIETIKILAGTNTNLLFGALPYRPNEIMTSKAKNEQLLDLGWKPAYTLQAALQSMLKN